MTEYERIAFVGASLTLGGKLDMSFYVASADLDGTGYIARMAETDALYGMIMKFIKASYNMFH